MEAILDLDISHFLLVLHNFELNAVRSEYKEPSIRQSNRTVKTCRTVYRTHNSDDNADNGFCNIWWYIWKTPWTVYWHNLDVNRDNAVCSASNKKKTSRPWQNNLIQDDFLMLKELTKNEAINGNNWIKCIYWYDGVRHFKTHSLLLICYSGTTTWQIS